MTRCEVDPGYCGVAADEPTKITSGELGQLNVIVILPITLIVMVPLVAARCRFRDDDVREPTDAQLVRLRSRNIGPIDPPMFLGGCGLLPLECGISGILTIVTIMVMVFVVT
jgi:hypothetical protein